MFAHSPLNVFVSSTWVDLRLERESVARVLHRMREIKYIGMEYFGSRPETPLEISLQEVMNSTLYIGIFGSRYGSGITEREYRCARDRKLPCFIYFKDESVLNHASHEKDLEHSQKQLQFKSELKVNHVVSTFRDPDELAMFVGSDLHRWISDNLFSSQASDAMGGRATTKQMNELIAAFGDLRHLVKDLKKNSNEALGSQAIGDRSVAIGNNNHGDIYTGDIVFKIYENTPRMLSSYMRVAEFYNLIEGKTRTFVGRDFIFDQIDNYLHDRKNFASGYIIIKGEPGIGKTALMAKMAKTRGYIHHFNISAQNIRSTRDFLGNIIAQLIVRYELNYGTLPPAALDDSGFLSQVLRESAIKTNGDNIVILVDALDEADPGQFPSQNCLLLPPSLPDGVFFIITTRERHSNRLVVSDQRFILLHDNDAANLKDIQEFIRDFFITHKEEMGARLGSWKVSADEFVQILTDSSQGNFMYLVHVLRDILTGTLNSQNLENVNNLPKGLRDYYQRHWRDMHSLDRQRFSNYYEPVICVLAAAREAVPISQIVAWTKNDWPHLESGEIREVVNTWKEFLNESQSGNGTQLYRIYHKSFQDFLAEEVGLTSYNAMIAAHALAKIPAWKSSER
jgi:hypothetical protein